MKRWLRPVGNVKTQLVASFLLLTVLIVTASLGIFYFLVLDILQKRSEDSTVLLFNQAEYSIVQFRSEMEKLSKLIQVEPAVQNYLEEFPELQGFSLMELEVTVSRRLSQILNNYTFLDSIYLYNHDAGKVIEIMKNRELVTEDDKFFGSSLYMLGKENYPRLEWTGANPASLFSIYAYSDTAMTTPTILSAIRGIKSLNGKEQSGTLVLNLNEQVLANIFGTLYTSPKSNIYITNTDGVIISDRNKTNLGTTSLYFHDIPANQSHGSFTSEADGTKKQIVYYAVSNSGWTLIKEIPFEEFLKDTRMIQWSVLGLIIVSTLVSFILAFYLIKALTSPLRELSNAMILLEKGELGSTIYSLPNNEFGRLGRHFNRMSASILKLVEDNKRIENEKSQQEMNALQAQINPHFLYNTLNSLKMMAQMVQASHVAEGITTLGVILKGIFKADGPLCSLGEEVEFTQNYVKIMNYRFGERVTYVVDVPEALLSSKVVRFLLQPILENAFLHGFTEEFYTGVIRLEAHADEGNLVILVSDTGKGMNDAELNSVRARVAEENIGMVHSGKGIGLRNVYHRMRLHFKGACSLHIEASPANGTTITIVMPLGRV
ncbi:cache domain-containing sensor histidine kinase [Paenibacillus cymbidii]|uniref:cache domain-containing sensor histidine kinase n=1 Tax=Paenibacillus cymbidii TaxID=1639034 RepID=UPI001080DFD7|nr:sensor histidine kinase [Paenibacillus cymbidii]